MPGSKASMAVQETHRDTPPSQGPRSTRSTESQKKRNGYERAGGEWLPVVFRIYSYDVIRVVADTPKNKPLLSFRSLNTEVIGSYL